VGRPGGARGAHHLPRSTAGRQRPEAHPIQVRSCAHLCHGLLHGRTTWLIIATNT